MSRKEAVGSCVCFIDGVPVKRFYRRYKIRGMGTLDDVGMMREVLCRRFMRHKGSRAKGGLSIIERAGLVHAGYKPSLPNLIIVDGGLAHSNMAKKMLDSLGLYDIYVIGIAKKKEEVWIPFSKNPVAIVRNSPELKLIQKIRDEAHRFARKYHLYIRKAEFYGV